MFLIKKEIANIWEYKVGNNANIANFVRLWKPRMRLLSFDYYMLTDNGLFSTGQTAYWFLKQLYIQLIFGNQIHVF